MLLVSEVEETEIFKICLEYWNHLAAELYRESPFSTSSTPLLSDVPPRRHLYLPVLSQVGLLLRTHTQRLYPQNVNGLRGHTLVPNATYDYIEQHCNHILMIIYWSYIFLNGIKCLQTSKTK